MAGDSGAAQEWRAAYDRVSEMAQQAGDQGLSVPVPATPAWSAKDLLAHMIGVDVDTVSGDAAEDLNEQWTQGHVDSRRDKSVEDLLAEWDGVAADTETFVRETDVAPIGDILIHEQDLRGALSNPGARDTDGLGAVRDQMLGMLGDAIPDGQAPLALEATDGDFTWSSGDGEPGVTLKASQFDLARAAMSRRSAWQLRDYTTDGDVDAYLGAFAHLGPLPEAPLPE